MNKIAAALATLPLLAAACSSPMTDTSASGSAITSLSPSSGPVGTLVTIHGSGFDATGNTVSFAASVVEPPGQMPNEPSVIPELSSADGRTIVFNVLAGWRPACSYPPGPCPIANIPTAPGTYSVSVTNSSGTSNSVSFLVTR